MGILIRSDSFEIMTRAVGDCLLDAVSRLVYANQNHARELRTRMTLEAVVNSNWYLMDENLGINLPRLDTAHSLVERYSLYAGTQAKDYKTTYEQEVIRCFKSGEYCGLWQIHHVSSVIGCPIICLFPEIEDVEDEAPLRYFHNRTIYPREVARRSAEPITIMWSKASPVQEGVTLVNHIVPVIRKYPVVHFLFKGEVEDGAPTEEHFFLYENFAEEEAQEVTNRKDSENGGFPTISDSSTITNGSKAVNDTKGKGRKKVTNRGASCSTKIILPPRPGKFIPTPGYSILSDTKKQK